MADSFNPDSVYPPRARRTSYWWIVRTSITSGNSVVMIYSPLSLTLHSDKAAAEQFMKERVAVLKPTQVKIILGPVSGDEAFTWMTLNPYIYTAPAGAASATDGGGSVSSPGKGTGSNNKDDPYKNDPNAA